MCSQLSRPYAALRVIDVSAHRSRLCGVGQPRSSFLEAVLLTLIEQVLTNREMDRTVNRSTKRKECFIEIHLTSDAEINLL